MVARELYILGTASQVPTRHRNHNGYFLRWDKEGILFDPGEGTQRQLTLAGLAVSAITRICITHFHGDHCLGLPGIIQRLSLENASRVTLHYPASGQVYYERLRDASIYAGLAKLDPQPISSAGILFEDDSLVLETHKLDHEVDCYGYRIQEKDQLRIRQELLDGTGLKGSVVGQLLRDGKVEHEGKTIKRHQVCEVRPGQAFAFIMDTRVCEAAQKLALGADLLVCESTFLKTETELAGQSGHMTALQAGQLAHDAGARKLVLGHFSQRYEDSRLFLQEALVAHNDVVLAIEPKADGNAQDHRILVPERKEIRFKGQFEAHITVDAPEPEAFEKICRTMGLKCILIELAEGVSANQPMTESKHQGDLNIVRAEVDALAQSLEEAGFCVKRRKIEARYDAQGVPETDSDTRGLPATCYFEYHTAINLSGEKDQLKALRKCATPHGAHVSRNARKIGADGQEERFVTLRVYRAGRETAEKRYGSLVADLRKSGMQIADERREFTVYDSNIDLDRGWLSR